MVNKKLKGIASPKMAAPDTTNRAGAPAYSPTPEDEIVNLLMCGTTKNAFYASARENYHEALDAIKNFPDTEFLAKAILYARNYGFMRTIPITALVEVSRRDPALFKKMWRNVLYTPKDWSQFIDIARTGALRKGIGRSVKNEMISAIGNISPYTAMKYPTECKDMIRISRCRETVNNLVIKFLMEGADEGVDSFKALRGLGEITPDEAAAKILIHRLPYEAVRIRRTFEPVIWAALFDSAPMFFLLKNLRNFDKAGVFDDREMRETMISRITNVGAIKKAKILPFRMYQAFSNCANADVKSALKRSVQLAALNLPKITKPVTLLVDVSGSMTCEVSGNSLTAAEEAGILTGSILDMSDRVDLMAFDHNPNDRATAAITKAFAKDGIMGVAVALANSNGGGTSIANALEYALRTKSIGEKVVIVTDSETWIGSLNNAADEVLAKYPKTHIYFVQCVQGSSRALPTNPRVHYIHGFNDSVLRYIALDAENQIRDIKEMEI